MRLPTKFSVTRLRVSPDGRWLAAGENRGYLEIFDTTDGTLRIAMPLGSERAVFSIAWSKRNHLAVTTPSDIRIVSPENPEMKLVINMPQSPYALSFHPDGERLAVAGQHRTLSILNPYEGKTLREMTGNSNTINAIAFHPNGTRLATAGVDGAVRIWDPESGKELLTLHGGEADCTDIHWDREGMSLFTLGSVVRTWSCRNELK